MTDAFRWGDWSTVGRPSDPTPGDPTVVNAGGNNYGNVAEALVRASSMLQSMDGGESSGSEAVKALLEGTQELATQIVRAVGRYEAAGEALTTYAAILNEVQVSTQMALAVANVARDEADRCITLAKRYEGYAAEATDPDEVSRYTSLALRFREDAAFEQSRVAAQIRVVDDAVETRDSAAQRAMLPFDNVSNNDELNDTIADNFWGKVTLLLEAIALLCDALASFLGIVAFYLSWIPLLGDAAKVFTKWAAVLSAVSALCNLGLFLLGERSLTQLIVSITLAGVACLAVIKPVQRAIGRVTSMANMTHVGGTLLLALTTFGTVLTGVSTGLDMVYYRDRNAQR